MANAFSSYMRESAEELRKVTWPNRKTVVRDTIIVLVSSVVLALVFGGLDFGLTEGFGKLIDMTATL